VRNPTVRDQLRIGQVHGDQVTVKFHHRCPDRYLADAEKQSLAERGAQTGSDRDSHGATVDQAGHDRITPKVW
jgi:hypothetical protein